MTTTFFSNLVKQWHNHSMEGHDPRAYMLEVILVLFLFQLPFHYPGDLLKLVAENVFKKYHLCCVILNFLMRCRAQFLNSF